MKTSVRVGIALACVPLAAACSIPGSSPDEGSDEPAAAELSASVDDGASDVPVDKVVRTLVDNGSIEDVELFAEDDKDTKTIPGQKSGDAWISSGMLEPGETYRLEATATNEHDETVELSRSFDTQELGDENQAYPSVAPLNGETVGVGMPVMVYFDAPVDEDHRALFERKMSVTSDADVEGSWRWISGTEVHWRPKEYWPADTDVTVDLRINGLPAGDGVYGQKDQKVQFSVGKSVVSTVDVAAHDMEVSINGDVEKTLPVSAGDAQHPTRRGTKLVMEKRESVDMDAASTGVDEDDPDYYYVEDVKWALRLTNSGEFIHAAPWSSGAHGNANVSHGCTGLDTSDANWFYNISHRGDPIEFKNTPREPEPGNGWTDWNVSWDDWKDGSALNEHS